MHDDLVPERLESLKPKSSGFAYEKYGSLVLRFLNRLKVTGKSAHTITAYRNDLNFFGRFLKDTRCDPGSQSATVVAEWVYYLETHGRTSAASIRRAQMSVRTFMHFLVENKVIGASPFLNIKSPKQPKNRLQCIPEDKFNTLCKFLKSKALAKDSKAIRDLALVLVLGKAGLKASEVASLQWADLHLPRRGRGCITIRSSEKARLVHIDASVKAALSSLQSEVRPELSKSLSKEPPTVTTQTIAPNTKLSSEPVFFGFQNVTRRVSSKNVQRHSVKFIIYELCQEYFGIPYNSESFRNHAILLWLKSGLSIEKIADLAGYSSLHSLERFLTSDSIPLHFGRKGVTSRSTAENEPESAAQADRKI